MKEVIKKYWPLIVLLAILLTTVIILLKASLDLDGGHFVYSGDDAYIHMALAKNFAEHGIWGVSKYEFSSSSSSLLWTLLLAMIYFLFRANTITPLILNLIFAIILIILVYALLRKHKMPNYAAFFLILIMVYCSYIPTIIFLGLEHIMHMVFSIGFLYLASLEISKENKPSSRLDFNSLMLVANGVALLMSRFEGMFLIGVVCALLLFRRKIWLMLIVGTVAFLPLFIYGLISSSHGSFFLPNSVMLKGNVAYLFSCAGLEKLFQQALGRLVHRFALVILVVSLGLIYLQYKYSPKIWRQSMIMLIVFASVAFIHLKLPTAGFFRYEAYLTTMGIFTLGFIINDNIPNDYRFKGLNIYSLVMVGALALIGGLYSKKAYIILKESPLGTKNIYEQQYQMARFVKRYYPGQVIGAGDVGAINYFSDIRIIDLNGIANAEVAKEWMRQSHNSEFMYSLGVKEKITFAMVYDELFKSFGGVPSRWQKVGEWKIKNNVNCGGDTVSFYAVDPKSTNDLIKNLKDFAQSLPPDVQQMGEYTQIKIQK